MKLKEHIEILQGIYDNYGDLDLIYAKDDEGNGYNYVKYSPAFMYYNEADRDIINECYIEDYDISEYKHVVCIN